MEVARYWRLKQQRYALVGEVCPHCDTKVFPPRDVCPHCGGESGTQQVFNGKGKVVSYTIMKDTLSAKKTNAPTIEKSFAPQQTEISSETVVTLKPSGIIYRAALTTS